MLVKTLYVGVRVDDCPTKPYTATSTRFNLRGLLRDPHVVAINDATYGRKERTAERFLVRPASLQVGHTITPNTVLNGSANRCQFRDLVSRYFYD